MKAIYIKTDKSTENLVYTIKERGINFSEFVRNAIKEKFERDLFTLPDEAPKEEWEKLAFEINQKLKTI